MSGDYDCGPNGPRWWKRLVPDGDGFAEFAALLLVLIVAAAFITHGGRP